MSKIIGDFDYLFQEQKIWEIETIKQRQEIMMLNAVYKPEKLKKITEILSEEPDISLYDVGRQLKQSNFIISIYEKIFVLKSQIAYQTQLLQNYQTKNEKTQGFFKEKKESVEKKLIRVQERKSMLLNELRVLEDEYQRSYKKSLESYY